MDQAIRDLLAKLRTLEQEEEKVLALRRRMMEVALSGIADSLDSLALRADESKEGQKGIRGQLLQEVLRVNQESGAQTTPTDAGTAQLAFDKQVVVDDQIKLRIELIEGNVADQIVDVKFKTPKLRKWLEAMLAIGQTPVGAHFEPVPILRVTWPSPANNE